MHTYAHVCLLCFPLQFRGTGFILQNALMGKTGAVVIFRGTSNIKAGRSGNVFRKKNWRNRRKPSFKNLLL